MGLFAVESAPQLEIYVQDYYPTGHTTGGRRPSDDRTYNQADGPYTNQPNARYLGLPRVRRSLSPRRWPRTVPAPRRVRLHPVHQNPTGANWYNDWTFFNQQFLPDWKAAVDKIARSTPARSGRSGHRSPGDASWHADRTSVWLDYAKQTGTLPLFMIWHELGIDNLATYRSHYDEYGPWRRRRASRRSRSTSPSTGSSATWACPVNWSSGFDVRGHQGRRADGVLETTRATSPTTPLVPTGERRVVDVQVVRRPGGPAASGQGHPAAVNVADTLQGISARSTAPTRRPRCCTEDRAPTR